jgi:Flp pilus assembly protein TadD
VEYSVARKPKIVAPRKPVIRKPTVVGSAKAAKPTDAPAAVVPATETPAADADSSLPPDSGAGLRDREAARVFALATDLHRRGEFDQAVLSYSRALNLDPANSGIYNNLGVCLRAQGKMAAAVACYRRALVLKPNDAGILSNLGNTLRIMGDFRQAIASLSSAVRLAPQSPEAVYNLGLILRDVGEIEKALTCFESALSLRKDYAACRMDYGTTLIMKGELAKGFEEFEWRTRLPGMPKPDPEKPVWDGSPLGGKTVLIRQEGGLGDVLQFARYIPMVKEQGGIVVVECHSRASRLIAAIPGVDKVVMLGSPLPAFDVQVAIMSLPHVLGQGGNTFADTVPYIKPPQLHSIQLPPSRGRQVRTGLCWSPGVPLTGVADRSCPLSGLVGLLAIPGVTAFSLQMGERASDREAEACDALLSDVGSKLTDLADLAAAIEQLDLIICVDSATAHTAGALGKETWVLLPYAADWRWHSPSEDEDRSTSVWYPSMRLFRQAVPGNWDAVFTALHDALYERVQH